MHWLEEERGSKIWSASYVPISNWKPRKGRKTAYRLKRPAMPRDGHSGT
jgi:hypothetical protein